MKLLCFENNDMVIDPGRFRYCLCQSGMAIGVEINGSYRPLAASGMFRACRTTRTASVHAKDCNMQNTVRMIS